MHREISWASLDSPGEEPGRTAATMGRSHGLTSGSCTDSKSTPTRDARAFTHGMTALVPYTGSQSVGANKIAVWLEDGLASARGTACKCDARMRKENTVMGMVQFGA